MTEQTVTTETVAAPSMYDRIGGRAAIAEAVDRFYRRLVDDPELAGFFGGDLTELKRHQAMLLTQVLGGPGKYEGRDLAEAHRPLGINEAQFHRVVFYLVGTLWELQVPVDITMAVGLTVMSLRDAVVQPDAA